MLASSFADHSKLVAHLDQAIRDKSVEALTEALRSTLCRIIRQGSIRWPEQIMQPALDHYARREIHQSPELGYSVIAMTWGPGQGTLLHDHCGMWCVEGVLYGDIEIAQFEKLADEGVRCRFEPRGTINAGKGSAGSLIPPHEYHTIANPSTDDVAVSLHIYSGAMSQCAVFRPVGGQWYERENRKLSLDH